MDLTGTLRKRSHMTRSQMRLLAFGNDSVSTKLEDGYPHVFVFSGIPCFAIVNFLSGQAEVRVSLPFMTRMMKHDFNFTSRKIFGSSELRSQIEKLSFVIKRKQKKESKDAK